MRMLFQNATKFFSKKQYAILLEVFRNSIRDFQDTVK